MLNVNKQTQKFKYKKKNDLYFSIKAGEKKSQSINIVAEGIQEKNVFSFDLDFDSSMDVSIFDSFGHGNIIYCWL